MKVPVLFAACGMCAVAGVFATPAAPVADAGQMDALVRQLGDEDFQVREKASYRLWEMGEVAVPLLERAADSDDPEQAARAREVLRKVRLFITPGTDAAVIRIVERYFKASVEEKQALMAQMIQRRAWRQVLKLYASENKADVRARLRPMVHGVALNAARESLRQGRAGEARGFLEMAPVESSTLLALADFHRSQGTWNEEMAKAAEGKGEKSLAWQLALYRAAGDLEHARDIARQTGDAGVSGLLSALSGDPVPWLEASLRGELKSTRRLRDEGDDLEDLPETLPSKEYLREMIRRWKGGGLKGGDLKEILIRSKARNSAIAAPAVNELFVLGETEAAGRGFVRISPMSAFVHYDSLECIPEALSALGTGRDKKDIEIWVRAQFEKMIKRDVDDQHEAATESEELLLLASFYERRGMGDEAWELFSPVLAEVEKEDRNIHQDFLSLLFGNRSSQSGAPQLALRLIRDWAGDEKKRWDEAAAFSFGQDDETALWWPWLAEIHPKSTYPERMEAMLALKTMGGEFSELRERWLALAWKKIDTLPQNEQDDWIKRLLQLSLETGDVKNALKAWGKIPEGERPENAWMQIMFDLSAMERWNECADLLVGQFKRVKEAEENEDGGFNPALHAYAAAALRKAGRLEEAEEQERWLDQLFLADVTVAIQAGHGYAFGMDYTRAGEWWRRAALLSEPGSREMPQAFKLHNDMLLDAGAWKELGGVSEVLIWMYLSGRYEMETPMPVLRLRLQSDMARALRMVESDRGSAVGILENCHRLFSSDGALADFFFPALRRAGLVKEHDAWFDESWKRFLEVLKAYPGSDNTANTAAWMASRALRNLDQAEGLLRQALKAKPAQSAYLDTMAEIHFARGDRKNALEWSRKAVLSFPQDPDLRRQHQRFATAPFPK